MATISYDTELMLNQIAARAVAAGTSFVTVLEPTSRRPAVISISNSTPPQLELIKENESGVRFIVPLGQKLSLPSNAKISAFVAEQGLDLRVYLAVASTRDDGASTVHIAKPFTLDQVDALQLLPSQGLPFVHQMFMGPVTSPDDFPMLVAAIAPLGRPGNGSDLQRIVVNAKQGQTEQLQKFTMTENADAILSVAAASHQSWGHGIWILYKIQGQTKIRGQFAYQSQRAGGGLGFHNADPPCPAGATSLASFAEDGGQTGLLISADSGLYVISADDATDGTVPATLIAQDKFFQSSATLTVAQDGEMISVWADGKSGVLGYISGKVAGIGNRPASKPGIPVMPAGSSTRFSASISQASNTASSSSVKQSIISVGSAGELTLLQQNKDTGIWKSEPFAVEDHTTYIDVQSYTFRIHATDSVGRPVNRGKVRVKASSDITCVANGQTCNISADRDGTWLSTNCAGELSLIVATDGVAGRSLTIDRVSDRHDKEIKLKKEETIDPSLKVLEAFSAIKPETDLSSLRTKHGAPLWDNPSDKPPQEDMKQAALCFSRLHEARKDLVTPIVHVNNIRAMASDGMALKEVGDDIMDAFNWVKHKVEDAIDWVVETVQGIWRFTCTIAGEVKRFILDCVEKVGEAFTWVWNKIKLGIDKLIEFAGWLFDWEDILATKDSIKSLLNAGLEFGNQKLVTAEQKVDSFFRGLQDKLDERATSDKITPADTAKQEASSKSDPSTGATKSVSFNHLNERFQHGAGSSSMKNVPSTEFSSDPSWEQVFSPLGESIMATVAGAVKDISDLFDQNNKMSTSDLWKKLGKDLLRNCIGIVREIALTLLKLGQKLLNGLGKLGNTRINIPVITALYEWKTGGTLTLFDAVCFILGFMTCILSKIITQRAPPRLENFNAASLNSLVSGNADKQTKVDLALFGGSLSITVVVLKNLYDTYKLVSSAASGGNEAAVETLSSGPALFCFGIVTDVVGILVAMPSDSSAPGYELRRWAAYMGCLSAASSVLFKFTSIGGEDAAKKIEIWKMVLQLVNFGLYEATFVHELDNDVNWAGKDEALSIMGGLENIWNTVKAAGKTVACTTVNSDDEVAAIALGVMTGGASALTINKGITLHRTYEVKAESPRGVAPA